MNFSNYIGMASAHEVAQDYHTAAAFDRRAIEERPNAMWIYRHLAPSLSGAGRMEEAGHAYAETMRTYPGLTVSKYQQAMVFSEPVLERMAINLRKLGLPI
jgi:adenylate cyclase